MTVENIMKLADEYAGRSQLTEQGETLSREALRTALTELAAENTRLANAWNNMQKAKRKAVESEREVWNERDTLRQQLAEAQALIEASRKQEAVAWLITAAGTKRQEVQLCKPYRLLTSERVRPLYATPVVAPDVLSALKMAVLQNSHDMLMTGEEIRKCESAIQAAAKGVA